MKPEMKGLVRQEGFVVVFRPWQAKRRSPDKGAVFQKLYDDRDTALAEANAFVGQTSVWQFVEEGKAVKIA